MESARRNALNLKTAAETFRNLAEFSEKASGMGVAGLVQDACEKVLPIYRKAMTMYQDHGLDKMAEGLMGKRVERTDGGWDLMRRFYVAIREILDMSEKTGKPLPAGVLEAVELPWERHSMLIHDYRDYLMGEGEFDKDKFDESPTGELSKALAEEAKKTFATLIDWNAEKKGAYVLMRDALSSMEMELERASSYVAEVDILTQSALSRMRAIRKCMVRMERMKTEVHDGDMKDVAELAGRLGGTVQALKHNAGSAMGDAKALKEKIRGVIEKLKAENEA